MSSVRAAMYWLAAGLFAVTASEGHAFSGKRGSATCGTASDSGGSCEAQNFVGQADFERVQAILEQAGMGGKAGAERIKEQREQAEAIQESAHRGLEALKRDDLPERLSEAAREGSPTTEGFPFSPAGTAQPPTTRHTLFLSASVPAEERRLLLQHAERATESHPDAEVGVYLQGPVGGKDITHTQKVILDWLRDAGIDRGDLQIGMDNKVFDRHGVEVVPTWVSEKDGEVVARAAGLGSLKSVLERAEAARERGEDSDLGKRGQTWAIAEPHFRDEFVPRRVRAWVEEQGGKEAILERARSSYWDHQAITSFDLGVAEEEHSYLVDLEVTATEDIRNPDTGRLIVPKGTSVRPSDAIRWTRHIAFFDPTRPAEREWVSRWLERKREAGVAASNLLLFITNIRRDNGGAWEHYRQISEEYGISPYLLDSALKERLGIQVTPSTVTPIQGGERLQVTEHPTAGGPLAAFSRLIATRLQTGLEESLSGLVPTARAEEGAAGGKTPDEAADAACNDADFFGSLVNDVCWDCHTPWSFSGEDIGKDAPPGFYDKPACMCEPPDAGISTGAWLPARLVEIVRTPYCSPVFGGSVLDFGVGAENMYAGGRDESEPDSEKAWFRHYHYWSFPAGEVLGMTLGCEVGPDNIDAMYYSEMDGAWNDDQVALMTHPEGALFATSVAQIPCAVESVRLSAGKAPTNELFWCAGSWGSLYPFAGWITHNKSPVRDVALLSARVLASLGRRGLLHDLVGDPCEFRPMPQLIKTNFRWQHIFPVPDANNTHWIGEEPIGRWGEYRNQATKGEDYVRLLWRWTDCCLDF